MLLKWRPPMSMQFWSLPRKFTIAPSTISCGIALISWVIAAFSFSKFASRCWYTCDLTCPHKKNHRELNPGNVEATQYRLAEKQDDPETCHRGFRVNVGRNTTAPSCWNHTSSGLWSASNRITWTKKPLEHFTIMVWCNFPLQSPRRWNYPRHTRW